MITNVRRVLLSALISATPLCAASAFADIQLLGVGVIPGNATDQSGLNGLLEDGVTPHNLVGGFGSAITYSGFSNLYYATPDRGPADGATSYIDRLYTLRIKVKANGSSYTVTPTVEKTRLLRTQEQGHFIGLASAFDPTNSSASLRFDPEGVRVDACGRSVFVSDEYGPFLYKFNVATGKRTQVMKLPTKFLADYPSATPADELSKNLSGRQSNRGMEGLAISPEGSKLYGIMQSPLIQDGGLDVVFKRVGTNVRILEIEIATGAVREFLYSLADKGYGISEIVAVNDHELLVLERDGKPGAEAKFKKIVKIGIADATDIRAVKALPSTGIPSGITAVSKQVLIDLLDPAFGLAGATFPEKIEGLAFGPDLPDGRHLLIVTNDNDFDPTQNSQLFAFAIDHADLVGYQAQQVSRGHCEDKDEG
ncbi:MAG: esterase-like activity of phytase family protein [Porticoccaceae bacterium]